MTKLVAVRSVAVAAASVTYVAVVSGRQMFTSSEKQAAVQAKPAAKEPPAKQNGATVTFGRRRLLTAANRACR